LITNSSSTIGESSSSLNGETLFLVCVFLIDFYLLLSLSK
jgi:hypothetical protein